MDFFLDRITKSGQTGFGFLQWLLLFFGLTMCIGAFYKEYWKHSTKNIILKTYGFLLRIFVQIITPFDRYYGFEIFAFLLIALIYFYNPITQNYPLGYGGLYQLEIDELVHNNFALPERIPYYGPGGIPAAYPFLGFYLGAFFQKSLNVTYIDYFRFAPSIWTFFAFIAMYFFVKTICQNRYISILSTLLTAFTIETYNIHATAAGIIRGPALLFMFLSLMAIWKITHERNVNKVEIFKGGLFIALSAMIHLSYLVFIIFSTILFMFLKQNQPWKKVVINLAITALLSGLLSSPWWITIIHRYGINSLFNAFNSHGTLGVIGRIFNGEFSYVIDSIFSSWGAIPLIGLTLLGFVYAIYKKNYVTFLWFFCTYFFIGENQRFLIIIGGILAAMMIFDLFNKYVTFDYLQDQPRSNIPGTIMVIILVSFIGVRFLHTIQDIKPSIDQNLISASEWLSENTSSDTKYLYFSSKHDSAEWIPYLSKRTHAIGQWGSEWLGDFTNRYVQWHSIVDCAMLKSESCYNNVILSENISFSYLIIDNPLGYEINPFNKSGFTLVYENSGYLIYRVE